MSVTLKFDELPTRQFTAGSIASANGWRLDETRAALDEFVDQGLLTVKSAKSGARNYSRVKGAAAPAPATPTEAVETAEQPPVPMADETGTIYEDRRQRVQAAKIEAKLLKAWQQVGEPDPRPFTGNLDALNADYDAKVANGGKRPKARKQGSGKPRGTTVQFLHDGKPIPTSQNKLSSVAWYYTRGIGGDDVKRISVDDLRKLFADAGIDDPANTAGWSVTLPNGVVISTEAFAQ